MELERILLEKSDVQDVLIKMEAICANHEQDKQRLQEELKKVTSITVQMCSKARKPVMLTN